MLKPVPMAKVRAIALRKDLEDTVALLHEMGAVQLTKYEDKRLSAEKPIEAYQPLMAQLVRLRAIEAALKPVPITEKQKLLPLGELLAECQALRLDKTLSQMRDRLEAIRAESEELSEAEEIFEALQGLEVDVSSLKSKDITYFVGKIPYQKLVKLDRTVAKITDRYVLRAKATGRFERACIIVIDRKYGEQAANAIAKIGFAEARLPPIPGKPGHVLRTVKERLVKLKAEKSELIKMQEKLSAENYGKAVALREMLEIHSDRARAPSNFSGTEHAFVFEGWVPAAHYSGLEAALSNRFKGNAAIQQLKTDEMPPTLLSNPGFLKPFEFMVAFISLPESRELDPTILFALIFPVFYAMMLGDAGYGVASLFIALILMVKFKGTMLEPISRVWAYASFPTVLFGIVYDEFFGFRHADLLGFQLYHGIPRMENIIPLLLAMIALGALHMAFGFLLGAVNAVREKNYRHAVAKLSWVFLEISGIVLIATLMFSALPAWAAIPFGIIGFLALIPIAVFEGIPGLVEIPGLASNILSYARILAVGIASVVVAELINELLLPKPEMGVFMFVLMPIYLALHLMNIFIGMFEALVQGARLNYVEFFSKFYHGGGEPFKPFGYPRRFTA